MADASENNDPVRANYMRVRAELEKLEQQMERLRNQREGLMLALNVLDTKSPQLPLDEPRVYPSLAAAIMPRRGDPPRPGHPAELDRQP